MADDIEQVRTCLENELWSTWQCSHGWVGKG